MNCALCSKSSKGRLRRSTLDFLRESKNSKARMEDTSNGTARDVTMLQAASDCSDNCNDAGHLAGLCTWSCHEPHHVALLIMLERFTKNAMLMERSAWSGKPNRLKSCNCFAEPTVSKMPCVPLCFNIYRLSNVRQSAKSRCGHSKHHDNDGPIYVQVQLASIAFPFEEASFLSSSDWLLDDGEESTRRCFIVCVRVESTSTFDDARQPWCGDLTCRRCIKSLPTLQYLHTMLYGYVDRIDIVHLCHEVFLMHMLLWRVRTFVCWLQSLMTGVWRWQAKVSAPSRPSSSFLYTTQKNYRQAIDDLERTSNYDRTNIAVSATFNDAPDESCPETFLGKMWKTLWKIWKKWNIESSLPKPPI